MIESEKNTTEQIDGAENADEPNEPQAAAEEVTEQQNGSAEASLDVAAPDISAETTMAQDALIESTSNVDAMNEDVPPSTDALESALQSLESDDVVPDNPLAEEIVGEESLEASAVLEKVEETSEPPSAGLPLHRDDMRWYVVQAYSGHEMKVKRAIEERFRQDESTHLLAQILIPQENREEAKGGGRRKAAKNFYPGYLFVQMMLNEKTWHLIKDTPKVNGFVGGMHPTPVSESEIASITQQMVEGSVKPRPRVAYQQGDYVRVVSGAFANFAGTIEEVKPEKQKVRVLVSIFGRSTPVELNYNEVEKAV